jgi:hypothetical protein
LRGILFLVVLHFSLGPIVEVEITELAVLVRRDVSNERIRAERPGQRDIRGIEDESALLGQAPDQGRVVPIEVEVALNADIHFAGVGIPVFEGKGKDGRIMAEEGRGNKEETIGDVCGRIYDDKADQIFEAEERRITGTRG